MKRANWKHVMAWATLFAIFGTGSVRAGTNAWTSIGPEGGGIKALSVDPHHPGTLYAATEYPGAFTFKSTGGSDRWVKSGVPNKPLVFDPQDPDTIYAIDYSAERISKSTDGGTSWNPANSGLPDSGYPLALAIDPLKPSTLYAGTTQGIFKSTDGGTNWSPASSGLPQHNPPFPDQRDAIRPPSVYALVIDPQNPSTLYAVA